LACEDGFRGQRAMAPDYGGSAKSFGNSVVQTNDGGYAIAGYRISDEDGVRNIFMVRTDASGNELWNRTYMASEMGYAMSVAVLPDDSLVLAGVTYTYTGIAKARLIKTDANGNEIWNKTYGGPEKDEAHYVIPSGDGGFAIAGYTQSFGNQNGDFFVNGTGDMWLLKVDEQGNEQWNMTYGGDGVDEAYYVAQSADGGYLIGGTTRSFSNGSDRAYLVKTDSLGNEQWYRTYGDNSNDAIYTIVKADGGYVLSGTIYPRTGKCKGFLIKTDDTGNSIWNYSYGENGYYVGYSACSSGDGGIYASRSNEFDGRCQWCEFKRVYLKSKRGRYARNGSRQQYGRRQPGE